MSEPGPLQMAAASRWALGLQRRCLRDLVRAVQLDLLPPWFHGAEQGESGGFLGYAEEGEQGERGCIRASITSYQSSCQDILG